MIPTPTIKNNRPHSSVFALGRRSVKLAGLRGAFNTGSDGETITNFPAFFRGWEGLLASSLPDPTWLDVHTDHGLSMNHQSRR